MDKPFFRKFGNKVKKLRVNKGLTQEELAFEVDVARSYIGMIERAERDPTLFIVYKISRALDVTFPELFDYDKKLSN